MAAVSALNNTRLINVVTSTLSDRCGNALIQFAFSTFSQRRLAVRKWRGFNVEP